MKINNQLIRNLLPGLIPLFVFIIAEEIWGLKIGLIVAVSFGIAEFIYTYIKTKKVEKFILLDTLLLISLGIISALLENDIFFKLKPALIEFILVAIVGFSVFGPKNLILSMSKRYVKNMPITEAMQNQMNSSLKVIFFITIIHIFLVLYAAFYLSDRAWAFISGGLFYIIFFGYFAFEFLKNKISIKKHQNEEWLPIVDQKGKIIGQKPRSFFHNSKDKLLHPVVHLHVFNQKNELFLQKRPIDKLIQPGKWDTAVGGHVSVNETIEIALKRETEEEIGLIDFKANFITKYIWESEVEKELVFLFVVRTQNQLIINKDELDDGKFWRMNEIEKNIGKNIFTPNFEKEFKNYLLEN